MSCKTNLDIMDLTWDEAETWLKAVKGGAAVLLDVLPKQLDGLRSTVEGHTTVGIQAVTVYI